MLGFVGFNWKAFFLRWLSSPDEKPWNASRAQLFFMQVGALAMFASMAPTVHFLMTDFYKEDQSYSPQSYFACGPHYNSKGEDVISFMWAKHTPDGVKEAVEVLVSPVFLIVVNVVLVLTVILLLYIIVGASSEMKTMSAELEEEHFDKLKVRSTFLPCTPYARILLLNAHIVTHLHLHNHLQLLSNVGIVDVGVMEEETAEEDDGL